MKQIALALAAALALSGCNFLSKKEGRTPLIGPSAAAPALEDGALRPQGAFGAQAVRAEVLDTTTAEEKAAALEAAPTGGERELGKVVVALGPPAEQGLWMSTALVTEVVQGRITTAGGQSLALELRPGSSALLSLAAFQALGLSLTDLPEVTVFAP